MSEPRQQPYRIEEQTQRIEANPANHPRYSFMDSPTESDVPVFFSVPANTRSQTFGSDNQPTSSSKPPRSPYPLEKPSTSSALFPYNNPPPQETHPALFAPYADSAPPPNAHNALNSSQAPRPSSSLPVKGQLISPRPGSTNADITDDGLAGPAVRAGRLSESGLTARESQWSLPRAMQTPVYNPDSLSGPNGVTAANHQPGQSIHPNMELNNGQWRHGLCGCETSICALGICCPCVLYGKTEYRLSQRAAKKDPTDLLGYSACNGACGLMAVSCGFQCQYIHCICLKSIY